MDKTMNNPARRSIAALLCMQMLLGACSAAAQPPLHSDARWPEPRPQLWPAPQTPVVRNVPNFQAPSATHCARTPQTREVPGGYSVQGGGATHGWTGERRDRLTKSAPAAEPSIAAPPGPPSVAATPAARAEAGALYDSAASCRSQPPPSAAAPLWAPPQPQQQQAPAAQVTAGMVDDNAEFNAYLAFRNRTRVEHRPRDIRERYLLEVKDGRGRGIADAEVAVQAASGQAMWARTDAGGKVWLHPDAFDPARSPWYDVAVRKEGRQSGARLSRGQKSAVEAQLDARAAPQRAQLDLVFLIDATGSMADEIDKLKATLRTISAEVARLPSQPDLCFGLVAYRDRGDAFLMRSHDLTNDLDSFQGVLNALHAGGGGDYPEAMNEALHETVHNLSWRGEGATRLVVLLADAPPHLDYGAPHYDEDMLAALGKGIKVFSVGASGLDKQGEYIQRQIAQYTGGRFVFLTYADARNPARGAGRETVHDVKNYSVDTLDRLVVRLVADELAKLARGG